MRDLLVLLVDLLTSLARLLGPGGTRAVVADTLLVKHQLVILNRSRRRARNLTALDRIAMGLCTLVMIPGRIRKLATVLKPAMLLRYHQALNKSNYRRLFSPQRHGKPEPKRPIPSQTSTLSCVSDDPSRVLESESLEIARKACAAKSAGEVDCAFFLEELLVRRELADRAVW